MMCTANGADRSGFQHGVVNVRWCNLRTQQQWVILKRLKRMHRHVDNSELNRQESVQTGRANATAKPSVYSNGPTDHSTVTKLHRNEA